VARRDAALASHREEPACLVRCYRAMNRVLRGGALAAFLGLLLAVASSHWLGIRLPWSPAGGARPPATAPRVLPTPTPVDPYDLMGTLTFRGRTIPSARLLPTEVSLVEWLDDKGIRVSEIRPAAGWPSDRTSLPEVLRGVAVVHAFLIPPSVIVFDAMPVAGPLNASVCTSPIGEVISYQFQLGGRSAGFDYPQLLHVATYLSALLVTTSDDMSARLLNAGWLCPRRTSSVLEWSPCV